MAASFVALNVGNVFLMIGGVLLFFLCIGAEILFAKQGGGNYQGAMATFALIFLILLGIYAPHQNSVNSSHHAQALIDLPREYGQQFKVVDASVSDHWVEFQLPSCGKQIYRYDNMRLINGRYLLAITVVEKDKHGNSSVGYLGINPYKVADICRTAAVVP